ncbi:MULTISPECIES: YggT family protein [unclassified Frigoribacterium]|jgi:YggT family protein|uniref:YggT family protein n=1 Tax=unclassified Frigoribacterium TaxID=2627005 RepID=UPI000F468DCB|nr:MULTISPECIES: YggT family protein [unclassified Frigoribacterium]MBD8584280.1 YggT family protein [Frigoribacterium sp. CFBP 8766]MBD8609039.1 YggT family protein [Frigoribacterium sp. CFBP 13729]ROP77548.1 YggT family protein [Frigoribacterium sp. PhB107]TDT65400.1 YggT family protein [Frigoribacterium sp. PhB116]
MTFLIASIAYYALLLFFLLMWGRFVLDLAQSFSRGWRPRGPVLVLAEIAYTVTDPPIKAIRRVLPPVRLGSVALDFGWSIIMLAVVILMGVASGLRFA